MSDRVQFRYFGIGSIAALAVAAATPPAGAAPGDPAQEAPESTGQPTAMRDSKGALPPLPSAADLEAVRGLTSVDTLRETLLKAYPETFAGLYNNGDGTFTVLSVGDQSKVQSFSADYSAALLETDAPDIAYAGATHTLQHLMDTRDRIAADFDDLSGDGVWGAFLDESHNAVDVFVDQPAAGLAERLAATYGTDAIRVKVEPTPLNADRTNDVAPWNAGNQLASPDGGGCTSGFGFHDSAGNTWGSTAGHCGNRDWFNTNFFNPSFTSGRHVGKTLNNYYNPGTTNVDVQRIDGRTSKLFWKQGPGASRQWVAGVQNPTVGNAVCSEGSFGFERCGTVIDTGGSSSDGSIGLFFVSGAACQGGDSGGPMVWPTGYGFIAQGSVKGGTGSSCIGQQINEQIFVLRLGVNSLTTGP